MSTPITDKEREEKFEAILKKEFGWKSIRVYGRSEVMLAMTASYNLALDNAAEVAKVKTTHPQYHKACTGITFGCGGYETRVDKESITKLKLK
jgi:hypothetical protein